MFKRQLGISIYPEHFSKEETIEYLEKCSNNGINNVFMSLIHLGSSPDINIINLYKEMFLFAKKLGYYVILDITQETLNFLNIKINNLEKFKEMGISCLRLDAPLLPKEVADATYNEADIDIQINISNNDNFITNVIDYKPRKQNLFGCHNFYPLKNSALSFERFIISTKRFVDLGIHTSAFVGSKFGKKGPQKYEVSDLVSVESIRGLPLRTQAKILFSTNLISTVLVGNQPMSNEEIKQFSELLHLKKYEFDIKIEDNISINEKSILEYNNHFWRGDAGSDFVRSTWTRVDFNCEIEPNNIKKILNKGDVCIINSNNAHYQKELIVILKDNYTELGNSVNYIGNIMEYDLSLLDLLEGWDKFKFRGV
ncbi:MupG family TIM beta-alpha barrel fold protein [Spiroplasma culicicola]|uniref:Outer surface protein n=1 Tax=Spiroplasma culicicola AES-1 TaxID=1276246 RepID=W6A7P9_9MOLU|nr:MupG family TIM beta-alpha barrel fold protein [Spiroplasma culicicola]AHI53012.1 hypothetical protein SCULI_v1c06710 [Spiroplasma culicicola AES-1]